MARILLMDDDCDINTIIGYILESGGHRVVNAEANLLKRVEQILSDIPTV